MLLCTGVILMSVGVTGIYVGKTLDQSRGRPLFVVMDRTPVEADDTLRAAELYPSSVAAASAIASPARAGEANELRAG